MRVGVTADLRGGDGLPAYDLSLLDDAAGVEWEWIRGEGELTPDEVGPFDAIVLFHPYVTTATVSEPGRLRLVAGLGVGVDNIDVEACTAAGVLVTVTPDSVRRPMASGAMAFVLALAHRLLEMDRLVRSGVWDRFAHIGTGLQGGTLGIVGLGNVGRELAGLAQPFGLRVVAADPLLESARDVELLELDELLAEADFVVVTCPLTAETYHLVEARRLALMKRTAFLVNVARGPIVDGRALAEALRAHRIAGAALDVFARSPCRRTTRCSALDNVVLAPHAVGLTDELMRAGRTERLPRDPRRRRGPDARIPAQLLGAAAPPGSANGARLEARGPARRRALRAVARASRGSASTKRARSPSWSPDCELSHEVGGCTVPRLHAAEADRGEGADAPPASRESVAEDPVDVLRTSATPLSTSQTHSRRSANWSRFQTNPGTSRRTCTGRLPSASSRRVSVSTTSPGG